MINCNDTNSTDSKGIPRSLLKVAQHNTQIFTKSEAFNSRCGINDISLYSDNDLAGNDKNCRIIKKANLNQNSQTCPKQILTSDTNTDKHSEVKKYSNPNNNQQHNIYKETVQYDL